MNSAFDKFLITAMDRFVWFIILLVMTHLVTEFTKINGYTRGDRGNLIPINESMFLNAIEVPQLTMYPNHNLDMIKQPNQDHAAPSDHAPTGEEKTFSLRPIIDSIFDIPLSALNAVNRLVQRLTGNYYTPPTGTFPEKSPLIEKKS